MSNLYYKLFCIPILLALSSIVAAQGLNNVCEVHTVKYYPNSTDSEGSYINCMGEISTGLVISTKGNSAFVLTTSSLLDRTWFAWAKQVEPIYSEQLDPAKSIKVEGTLIEKNTELALFRIPLPDLKFVEIEFGEPTEKMAALVKIYNKDNYISLKGKIRMYR